MIVVSMLPLLNLHVHSIYGYRYDMFLGQLPCFRRHWQAHVMATTVKMRLRELRICRVCVCEKRLPKTIQGKGAKRVQEEQGCERTMPDDDDVRETCNSTDIML